MRHRKRVTKLGRTSAHRDALLAGLVCDLIGSRRIRTTLPKARAARQLAERMVTLGCKAQAAEAPEQKLHYRRQAISKLKQKERVSELFDTIAPVFADRPGGYTRIVKLETRRSDSSPMAYLEWVENIPAPEAAASSK
jgi:large subunit ribosomal protein L17